MDQKDRIEALEKDLSSLSEMVYEIQDNLKGSDSFTYLTNKISGEQEKLQKSTDMAFTQLGDLKNSIFATMALLFGIFAFISIDLNFARSIFSYDKNNSINSYLLIICFILGQFFLCVYSLLFIKTILL